MRFEIPFTSIGIPSRPGTGIELQMGLVVFNNDGGVGGTVLESHWPVNSNSQAATGWGRLSLGVPVYIPPAAKNVRSITFQEGSGITVKDAMIGGHVMCGVGMDYCTQWGNRVYQGEDATDAYYEKQPVRLALYTADWYMHSGKYFRASESEDYNGVHRPALTVTWGDP